MKVKTSRIVHVLSLLLCSFALLPLLAACDLFGGGDGNTSTTNQTPTTTAATAPTTGQMQTYQGDGFTISYPSNWQLTENKNTKLVSFKDSLTQSVFYIQSVNNPGGLISSDDVLKGMEDVLKASGSQDLKDEGSTTNVTVGGETWKQKQLSSTATEDNQQVKVKSFVLTNNHPASSPQTKTYILSYSAAELVFDTVNTATFQPMLQSFKYTG